MFRAALIDVGLLDTTFAVTAVDTDEDARARGFAESPALVVDGADLFDTGASGFIGVSDVRDL